MEREGHNCLVGCDVEEIDRVLAGGDLGSKEACKA